MKTTIDLPEELLIRAKVAAAQRKTTLKELVVQGLSHALEQKPAQDSETLRKERKRKLLAALQATNAKPMKPLTRDEIYER